jgi:hypothetical protein
MIESPDTKKERGWGLTILIPFTIVGCVLTIVIVLLDLFYLDYDIFSGVPSWAVILYLFQLTLAIVFLVATWWWKKWGCFGLIFLVLLGVIVNLIVGFQISLLAGSALLIVLMVAVYKAKEQYFE